MVNWKLLHDKIDPRIRESFPFSLDRGSARVIGYGYIGSTSHNTYVKPDNPDSIDDVDTFGVVLPPLDYCVGLKSWDHLTVQQDELDAVFMGYQKFVNLLLANNPNVLGFLWLRPEHYIIRTPAFERLLENRNAFSSQIAGNSFGGYARSQMEKMTRGAFQGYMGDKRKRLVERYGYDCKNASHLLRLLRMGTEFLETGKLNVYRTEDAEFFRMVKSGAYTLAEVKEMAETMEKRFQVARAMTKLPDKPNLELVNQLVVDTMREHVCKGGNP